MSDVIHKQLPGPPGPPGPAGQPGVKVNKIIV
jgi:hypothetical protein